jgi:hypothetical protein
VSVPLTFDALVAGSTLGYIPSLFLADFVVLVLAESHLTYHANTRTGYKRKLKKHYTSPVQEAANILRNQEGADSVDMEGKVVVVTGYVPLHK